MTRHALTFTMMITPATLRTTPPYSRMRHLKNLCLYTQDACSRRWSGRDTFLPSLSCRLFCDTFLPSLFRRSFCPLHRKRTQSRGISTIRLSTGLLLHCYFVNSLNKIVRRPRLGGPGESVVSSLSCCTSHEAAAPITHLTKSDTTFVTAKSDFLRQTLQPALLYRYMDLSFWDERHWPMQLSVRLRVNMRSRGDNAKTSKSVFPFNLPKLLDFSNE
jgi:hypothetical protein